MPEPVRLRLATQDDLPAINDIYNYFVVHSTCTYQTDPEPMESRARWFANHGGVHPVTVAELGDEVVGWGSLSRFHTREAYRRTVEDSVYIHHAHHRRGIGRAILTDLIDRARAHGHHTIIGGIDTGQAGSLALHAALGFREAAHLREVGNKFDRWLDVVYMQLILG